VTGVDIITAILLAGIVIAVIVYLLYWLYQRSSKEVSFVRTGLGGEKVILTGGALVLPIIHNITLVGMKTLRLEVRRGGGGALITKDRMRVEVVAEFYLRVRPTTEAVAAAAQSLGHRTMDAESLKDLVQGRFVDALSTIAATMTMDEMQEERGKYVKAVKDLVEHALTQNGLELEAVSLTGLDQTDIGLFNPNNAFDAEGLTRLTEQIEARKKVRNDIEQDTMIQIRNKNLEAEKLALEIERDSQYARLAQEHEVAVRRAKQRTEIAIDRAEREREAEEVEIRAQEEVEKARIFRQKAVEAETSLRETRLTEEIEARRQHRNEVEKDTAMQIWRKNLEAEKVHLDIERQIEFLRLEQSRDVAVRRVQQQAEVAREKAEREREAEEAEIRAREEIEKTRIAQEKAIDAERILREQETQRLDVQRRRILALDEKERTIAIAQKAREESEVQATVAQARAIEAEAEEKIFSIRETEVAERRKRVELILAALQAERESIQLTTISAAEKTAAEDRAEADRFASMAAKLRYEVDAEGKRQLNEAENMRSDASRRSALRIKLVEHLEGIIRESVKPMESIDAIKILQVEGLPGLSGAVPVGGGDDSSRDLGGGPGAGAGGPHNGSLADNIVSSALRYRAQAPFVDTLLKEIGMSPSDITRLGNLLGDEREEKAPPKAPTKQKK
jgi:uncharacterized membrane protein YqiK